MADKRPELIHLPAHTTAAIYNERHYPFLATTGWGNAKVPTSDIYLYYPQESYSPHSASQSLLRRKKQSQVSESPQSQEHISDLI